MSVVAGNICFANFKPSKVRSVAKIMYGSDVLAVEGGKKCTFKQSPTAKSAIVKGFFVSAKATWLQVAGLGVVVSMILTVIGDALALAAPGVATGNEDMTGSAVPSSVSGVPDRGVVVSVP